MGLFDKIFKKNEAKKIISEGYNELKNFSVKKETKRGYIQAQKILVDYASVKELKKRYIAFDVETTGLSPENNKIIEVAAILFEDGEIIQSYNSLVNPGVSVPPSATAINHITNEMVQNAPKETVVFSELVEFLGDVLNQQTAICAHNASFDMNFLSETLMRLGYNGEIFYVDTLSLSRNLIKGLTNYKQDTVAEYFGLVNTQSHRAGADAEICGKILWNLLQIKEKEEEKRLKDLEKNRPCDEELEVCAYIQNCILKNGGDSKWLGFYKNSGSYIDVSYLYSILKFKFAKKGKYIIVDKSYANKLDCKIEPCTASEGGADYVRVFFNSPFELEPLALYFYKTYSKCRKSALDYFKYNKRYETEHLNSPAMSNHLSDMEVAMLLENSQKRELTAKICSETSEPFSDTPQTPKKQDLPKENSIKEQIHTPNVKSASETTAKTAGRPILQLTDDMILIKKYDTIAQAVRETGINSKSIRDAAKGVQKHAGGYVWKYADEV